MTNNTEEQFVFVRFYVMLGDADGSLKGNAVMPLAEWQESEKIFADHLKKEGQHKLYDLEDGGSGMYYNIGLDAWKVIPCTKQEKEVLEKFVLGRKDYSFKYPEEFVGADY